MTTIEIGVSLIFRDIISGTSSTTFTMPSDYSELLVSNDGANTLTLTGDFGTGTKTLTFLTGEQQKISFNLPRLATITVTATSAFRIWISGV